MKRALPFLLLLVVGAVAFLAIGDVDGETLRAHHLQLRRLVDLHPVLAPVAAVLIYAVVVAACLPLSLWVTVACGFAFGTFWGGVLSIVGATLGAVVTFLAARTGLGQPLRRWAGPWLQKVERGLADGVWSYLLAIRMVPAFPFWLVNIVPALLRVPLPTFVATTALGIAPATFVLASVGAGLAEVFARGGTPDLSIMTEPAVTVPLVALAALAVAPVLWRRLRPRPPAPSG